MTCCVKIVSSRRGGGKERTGATHVVDEFRVLGVVDVGGEGDVVYRSIVVVISSYPEN